jgi:hypothetical protein
MKHTLYEKSLFSQLRSDIGIYNAKIFRERVEWRRQPRTAKIDTSGILESERPQW